MNLANRALRSNYTIFISKNKEQEEIIGSMIRYISGIGIEPYSFPKEYVEPIKKLTEVINLLDCGSLLQISSDGLHINSIIGNKKTEGPYCETKYLEVIEQAKGTTYYESLVNLNVAIAANDKNSKNSIKPDGLKEYKKLYEGVQEYE